MIAIRNENHYDKRKIAKELKAKGFISKTAISGMYYADAVKIIGNKAYNYTPTELKEIFKVNDYLRAICINYNGSNSYWYLIEDLLTLS